MQFQTMLYGMVWNSLKADLRPNRKLIAKEPGNFHSIDEYFNLLADVETELEKYSKQR